MSSAVRCAWQYIVPGSTLCLGAVVAAQRVPAAGNSLFGDALFGGWLPACFSGALSG